MVEKPDNGMAVSTTAQNEAQDAMMLIRRAVERDADAMGSLYVKVWQETYPSLIPNDVLLAMSPEGAARRWRATLAESGYRSGAVVAEDHPSGLIGLGSFGPNRDRGLPFGGEIFTLYVDPFHQGTGVGKALTTAMFEALVEGGIHSCIVWTLALNPSRFFYEAAGAEFVARKLDRIGGMPVELAAYGWSDLTAVLDTAELGGRIPPKASGTGLPKGVSKIVKNPSKPGFTA